jgi:hypothetical protein
VPVWEIPFSDRRDDFTLNGVTAPVRAYYPVVWVSVTRLEVADFPAEAPKFRALVDTGNNVSFNIRDEHLRAWAGLNADDLPLYGSEANLVYADGSRGAVPRRLAKVWLHPHPEDRLTGPWDLQVSRGIIVYETPTHGQTAASPGPELPLLGAAAFVPTRLKVSVDYDRAALRLSVLAPNRPAH